MEGTTGAGEEKAFAETEPTSRPQPERIQTAIHTGITVDTTSGRIAATKGTPTTATDTPTTPSPLERSASVISRVSRVSQGVRRSRFVEALDDDRSTDRLDQHYETGAYRGRRAADARSIRSVASFSSLHLASFDNGLPGGTDTPTSSGLYNEHTGAGDGGVDNPFSDVYGAQSRDQLATSLMGDMDGMIDTKDFPGGEEGTKQTPRVGSKALESNAANFFEKHVHLGDFNPTVHCPARRHFFRTKWVGGFVIFISIYATIVSGIFLVIAVRSPDWSMIRNNGWLTPSTASLLVAIGAKTVELSFGSSVVSFLGQVLSRRSLSVRRSGRGVTLAEMSMRNWINAPGYMVANYETMRFALFSILGITSFIAAIVATVYTSASDALVQPQLKLGGLETRIMKADVWTKFANHVYLGNNCKSPIPLSEDAVHRNATCLDISYAAQAYHDYQRYVSEWQSRSENRSLDTTERRVPAHSQFRSDIQVNGTWLEANAFELNGRIINNVSLAMPHVGVLNAAVDKRNKILQLDDLGGLGAYTLTASVPSPVIHVLCANLNRSELAPIVYTAWNSSTPLDAPTWPEQIKSVDNDAAINRTVVDDLFGWRKNGQNAPIFPRYPSVYNTVLNQTFNYGRDAIYLLGRDGDKVVERFSLCQLKASLTPDCSTAYSAVQDGSTLSARCDPADDAMAFINSDPSSKRGSATVSLDWPWIGTEWANSMSLNAGITDGRASIARLLTQSIIAEPRLQSDRPSLAEALAVLSSTTLLLGTQDAQMKMNWALGESILVVPETVTFNATLRERAYVSGATDGPQKLFYLVLGFAFLANVLYLVYFIYHRRLVTDFSEPPNLFSLAVNSPPAASMAGSCGGGPAGPQWNCEWFVAESNGHLFVVPKEAVPDVIAARGNMGNAWRVEEAASWPAGGHRRYYAQMPSPHTTTAGPDNHDTTSLVSTNYGSRTAGGDGLLQRLRRRFRGGGYAAASDFSPDAPSDTVYYAQSSDRGGIEYIGIGNQADAGIDRTAAASPTGSQNTAYTGSSRVGEGTYEMRGIGSASLRREGTQPVSASPISRAYSKLSRKRTFL